SLTVLRLAPALPYLFTLSLHDALPIWPAFAGWLVAGLSVFVSADLAYFVGEPLGGEKPGGFPVVMWSLGMVLLGLAALRGDERRSEEHTSELQSRENLVCRLLLEKKKT